MNDTQDIADALRDSGYSDDTASRIAEDIQKAIFQNNDVLENATLSEDGIRKVKTRLMGMNYTEEEAAKAIDALDDARGLKFIELMSWPYGWRSIYMD